MRTHAHMLRQTVHARESQETLDRLGKILITTSISPYFQMSYYNRRVIARWRCGNEEQRWLRKECRKCSSDDVSLEHAMLCYNIDERICVLLSEDGGGLRELRSFK